MPCTSKQKHIIYIKEGRLEMCSFLLWLFLLWLCLISFMLCKKKKKRQERKTWVVYFDPVTDAIPTLTKMSVAKAEWQCPCFVSEEALNVKLVGFLFILNSYPNPCTSKLHQKYILGSSATQLPSLKSIGRSFIMLCEGQRLWDFMEKDSHYELINSSSVQTKTKL